MKLPPIKRFAVEDFKGQESWIGNLLTPLNQILLALSSGLNKGITFKDNISAFTKTYTNTQWTPQTLPLTFKNPLSTPPTALWIGQVQDVSNTTKTIPGPVTCLWTYASLQDQITISSVTNLIDYQNYTITFVGF